MKKFKAKTTLKSFDALAKHIDKQTGDNAIKRGVAKKLRSEGKARKNLTKAEIIRAKAERTRARQGAAKTRYRSAAFASAVKSQADAKQATDLSTWNTTIKSESSSDRSGTTGADAPGDTNTKEDTTSSGNPWFWGK